MTPQESQNTLVNTDYPLDKIVYIDSGSFSVTSGSFPEINVPHGLAFRPMVIGSWSLTPDFAVSYDASFSAPSDPLQPYMGIQSTPTNIRFIPNNNSGSTVTFYWRVYGYMPPDVNAIAPFTATDADEFALSSDYNYTKIYLTNTLSWSSGTTHTISHNLGYRPQVEVWFEQELNADLLTRWYLGEDNSYTAFDRVHVTNSAVIFNFNSVGGVAGRKWYYRIYVDSQV